jgi:hypothetical protein
MLILNNPPIKQKTYHSQMVGTEPLKHVKRDIVFKNEHGDGILKHFEMQTDKIEPVV